MNKDQIQSKVTSEEIQKWMVSQIAKAIKINPDKVDVTAEFEQIGLDSVTTVQLTGSLGEWLGYDIDPTLFYEYGTIQGVANYLSENTTQN